MRDVKASIEHWTRLGAADGWLQHDGISQCVREHAVALAEAYLLIDVRLPHAPATQHSLSAQFSTALHLEIWQARLESAQLDDYAHLSTLSTHISVSDATHVLSRLQLVCREQPRGTIAELEAALPTGAARC